MLDILRSLLTRGFWNDADGFSMADLVIMVVLPIWTFVAVKLAVAARLTANQVDFFLIVSYPLLIVIGGKTVGSIPILNLRGRGAREIVEPANDSPDESESEQKI